MSTSNKTARETSKNSRTASTDKDYIYHPSFSLPGAEERLWGTDRPEVHIQRYGLLPVVNPESMKAPSRPRSLTAKQEKTLFLRFNYAKYRLTKVREGRQTPARDRQAELWMNRASAVREEIVHANLPLVPAMAKRMGPTDIEFSELVSEGYMAILRCVEKFDVSRGFKFSTYACRAIAACFYRLRTKGWTRRKHIPYQFDPEMEQSDEVDRRHDAQRSMAVYAVQQVLKENSAKLTGIERAVILKRFPIVPGETRETLSQLGKRLGLSDESVRQIESRSLRKLRDAVEQRLTV